MKPFVARLAAVLTLPTVLLGCSEGTDVAGSQSADAQEAQTQSVEATPTPEASDWSGLMDDATRAAIDSVLAAKSDQIGRFSFVAVENFEEEDDWLAAGLAASETGGPAIVVSTGQEIIHFAGDEGLAYFTDFRAKLADETADYFDRGEFVEGIEHATNRIAECYQSEDVCTS